MSARYFSAQKRTRKFAEADVDDVEFLRMKIGLSSEEYKAIHERYRNYAFSFAGAESNEQAQSVLDELISNRAAGGGYKEFAIMMQQKNMSMNSLAYWQNIRACQNAGQYQQMMLDTDIAPYWQYIATKDELTRPEHLAMQGLIRRYDDPIWDEWYPPNGFRCRCRVRSLSREYLKSKLGLQESDIPAGMPDMNEIRKNMGSRFSVQFALDIEKHRDEKTGLLMMKPDTGFNSNVGKDMYGWLKIKESTSTSEWEYIMNKKINFAKQLSSKKAKELPLFPYDKTKDLIEQKKDAEKILIDMFDVDNIFFDYIGKPLYIADTKKFIEHITEEQPERLKYISLVKEIIKNPDMIVQNVCVRPAESKLGKKSVKWNKKGQVKIVNEYIIKINENGKDVFVSLSRNHSQGHNNNVLWTLQRRDELKGVKVY